MIHFVYWSGLSCLVLADVLEFNAGLVRRMDGWMGGGGSRGNECMGGVLRMSEKGERGLICILSENT